MGTTMSSPPFHIRNLDEEGATTVRIHPRQYDQMIVEKQPDARLMYLDEDDGEIITARLLPRPSHETLLIRG